MSHTDNTQHAPLDMELVVNIKSTAATLIRRSGERDRAIRKVANCVLRSFVVTATASHPTSLKQLVADAVENLKPAKELDVTEDERVAGIKAAKFVLGKAINIHVDGRKFSRALNDVQRGIKRRVEAKTPAPKRKRRAPDAMLGEVGETKVPKSAMKPGYTNRRQYRKTPQRVRTR